MGPFLFAWGVISLGPVDERVRIAWQPKGETTITYRWSAGAPVRATGVTYLRFDGRINVSPSLKARPGIDWQVILQTPTPGKDRVIEKLHLDIDSKGSLIPGCLLFGSTPGISRVPFCYPTAAIWPGEAWLKPSYSKDLSQKDCLQGVTIYTYKGRVTIDRVDCFEVSAETSTVSGARPYNGRASYWLRTSDGSIERVRMGSVPHDFAFDSEQAVMNAPAYFTLDRQR